MSDAPQLLQDEKTIVWLRDPATMDYVREIQVSIPFRSRPPCWRKWFAHCGILVGYSTVKASVRSMNGSGNFMRRMLWLKTYDRALEPHGIYATGCPVEGVDPLTVKPGVWGVMNDRAWWGDANRGPAWTKENTEGNP